MKIQPFTNPQLLFRPSSVRSAATSNPSNTSTFPDLLSLTAKNAGSSVSSSNLLTQSIGRDALVYRNVSSIPLAASSSPLALATEEDTPLVTSPDPLAQPNGNDEIDYKNAKPIPMPSLPDPSTVANQPAPVENQPAPVENQPAPAGNPGVAVGSVGTGEQSPRVLIPPVESQLRSDLTNGLVSVDRY